MSKTTITASFDELSFPEILIFPNPSDGYLTINSIKEGSFFLIDAMGQVVRKIKLSDTNNFSTNIGDLDNGVYVMVGLNGTEAISKKIVVSK